MYAKSRIKVLIVDDSALVRQTMAEMLSSDPQIDVLGSARDPLYAIEKMKKSAPDVITLDVEMPRMDGLTFLQKIMSENPIPVVICSSLTGDNSETALKALEYGAVEILTKPKLGTKRFLEESRIQICDAVKAASQISLKKRRPRASMQAAPKLTADAVLARPAQQAMVQTTERVVLVGASTGGTEALREFLQALPLDAPGMVVVQHMPEHFTRAFAERLNTLCRVTIKEAADNDTVIPGRVLIAPGNSHALIKRSGARYYVQVRDGPLVSRHRPSVDVLFRSAARYAGRNCVGVIMTGMGDDGARGMSEMKEAGAVTFAQDEATCVVFGMPREAIKRGVVDKTLPLHALAGAVLEACG